MEEWDSGQCAHIMVIQFMVGFSEVDGTGIMAAITLYGSKKGL